MNIWTYWEGVMPEYIRTCLHSVTAVCAEPGINFQIVTPETVALFLPPGTLHENYLRLDKIALRADCVRAALLATHGGWWWDADTVGMLAPSRLPKAPAQYMTWTREPRRILNGYIYLEKGHVAAKQWLEAINDSVANSHTAAQWCDLGEKILTRVLTDTPDAVELPLSTFLPIDIDNNVAAFFSHEPFFKYVTNSTVCYGLNHSWFMYHKEKDMLTSPEHWAKSPLLIHQLLSAARHPC